MGHLICGHCCFLLYLFSPKYCGIYSRVSAEYGRIVKYLNVKTNVKMDVAFV